MIKRVFSVLLSLCLLLSVLPGQVSAEPYTLQEVNIPDPTKSAYLYDVETEEASFFRYEVPEDGAAVLIFFKTTCGNCQGAFSLLNEQDWVQNERIRIYAIESSEYSFPEIRTFREQQTPEIKDQITWLDSTSGNMCSNYLRAAGMEDSWVWPVVAICTTDESGQKMIRYVDTFVTDVRKIGNSLEVLLQEDLGIPKPVGLRVFVEEQYDPAAEAVALINRRRAELGLAELHHNRLLSELAMYRASELVILPTYERPDSSANLDIPREHCPGITDAFVDVVSYCQRPEDFLSILLRDSWTAFCLDLEDYTQIGVGCVEHNGSRYWSVMLTDDGESTEAATQTGVLPKTVTVNSYLSHLDDPGLSQIELTLAPGAEQELRLYGNVSRGSIPLVPASQSTSVKDGQTGEVIASVSVDERGTIRIHGTAEGSGTLEVWAYEGQPEPYTALIHVIDAPEYYPHRLHTAITGEGQIQLSHTEALFEEWIEMTILAEEGWWVKSFLVHDGAGNEIDCYYREENVYLFQMPASDVTVTASFLPDSVPDVPYFLLQFSNGFGSIQIIDDPGAFYATETVTFRPVPEDGYFLLELYITDPDGQVLELTDNGDGTYSFSMPASDVYVYATYSPVAGYDIALSVSGPGSVSVEPERAHPGETVRITFAPDEGYEIGYFYISLMENDYFWEDDCTLCFVMPDRDVMVDVSFTAIPISAGTFGDNLVWEVENNVLTISGEGSMNPTNEDWSAPWEFWISDLTEVVIHPGITDICPNAFFNCRNLTTVTIPDTVEHIGYHAFLWCENLSTVRLGGLPAEGIDEIAFSTVSANVIVPACGEVWTEDVTLDYGGSLTWNHSRSLTVTEPDCTSGGLTQWVCVCGESGTSHPTEPLGHHYEDGFCVRCGEEDATPPPVNPFADVAEADYFFEPVLWAVEQGITAGTGAGRFSPNQTCTRAQVVTFLWRAMGKPVPESDGNPFSDVSDTDYFYQAVLWAVENGITSGTGNGCFSPNNPCTRDQVVTFLWRTMNKPEPAQQENPFTDVAEHAYYYTPVLWAVENGITSGTSAATFSPGSPCTRAQVVTFLHRLLAGQ